MELKEEIILSLRREKAGSPNGTCGWIIKAGADGEVCQREKMG